MKLMTTTNVADVLGVEPWRVIRVFEEGLVPEPPKFARRRVITPELVPKIVTALRSKGWLAVSSEALEVSS